MCTRHLKKKRCEGCRKLFEKIMKKKTVCFVYYLERKSSSPCPQRGGKNIHRHTGKTSKDEGPLITSKDTTTTPGLEQPQLLLYNVDTTTLYTIPSKMGVLFRTFFALNFWTENQTGRI